MTKLSRYKFNNLDPFEFPTSQDGAAICIIADHLFNILAENGVTHLILRSDNAGITTTVFEQPNVRYHR